MIQSIIQTPQLKNNLLLSLLAIFIALLSLSASAANFTNSMPITGNNTDFESANFDRQFIKFLRRFQIPGAAVAIMKDNQVILSHGYGWADVENKIPVQPDSVFRVASVSKAITAVAVLQLVEQGKLNLDEKVFEVLSNLSPLENRDAKPHIQRITIRNLLQMSSGWYSDGPRDLDIMFGPWPARIERMLNDQVPPDCLTAARLTMSFPTHFTPGTRYSYSNINYCMLGLILNQVTGFNGDTGYEAYIKQQLLQPLGINDMHIGDTEWLNRDPNEVKYYLYGNGGMLEPNVDGLPYSNSQVLKKNYADGGWVASAVSLAKLVQAIGTNKILSPQMVQLMTEKPSFHTKVYNYFGMGWTVKYMRGHRYFLKTGSFTGTSALIVHADNGTSYVALFNTKPSDRNRFYNQLENLLFSQG